MTAHFILLALTLILLAFLFFVVGREAERNKLRKDFRSQKNGEAVELIETRKKLWDGGWAYILWTLLIIGMWFAFSYNDLRDRTIDRYRNGEIVENVTYKYQTVNGEKILKDSTVTYSRPEKE